MQNFQYSFAYVIYRFVVIADVESNHSGFNMRLLVFTLFLFECQEILQSI